MLKYLLAAVALLLAGVPAVLGLTSNASFSRDVPVRVPEQAQTVAPTPSHTATPSHAATHATDDDGTPDQGPGDAGPRDDRTEAGDDHGGHSDSHSGSHSGRHSGSDDSGDDDSGSHSGRDGSGSDDGSGHD